MKYVYKSKCLLAMLPLIGFAHSALGYTFSVTNHVPDEPIDVRIKVGVGETWRTVTLKPADAPGAEGKYHEWNIGGWSAGLCLDKIMYQPYRQDADGNWQQTGLWFEVDPKFVESDHFNKVVGAVESFTAGAKGSAAAVLKAIPGKGQIVGEVLEEAPLEELISGISSLVKYSFCKDRHFAILPNLDPDGDRIPGFIFMTLAR